MRDALSEELPIRFPWMFAEAGFRIKEHQYSYKAMGSSFATLESEALRLKFVNERGTIWVEVASPADLEQWMELGFLWAGIGRVRNWMAGWAS